MRIIAGSFKGRKIHPPHDHMTRPAMDHVRESVFNILHAYTNLNDHIVLDAFAGTGAYGIEALSRGARNATFIEKHYKAQHVLKKNIAPFEKSASLYTEDIFTCKHPPFLHSLCFLAPPYNKNLVTPALTHLIKHKWLDTNALIIAEIERSETLHSIVSIREKRYGKAKIIFFSLSEQSFSDI